MKQIKKYIIPVLRWLLLGTVIGCIGGALGAAFHHVLGYVTELRSDNNWLIYLLPVGGILSVGLYRILKLKDNHGTDEIIYDVANNKPVKPLIAPAIFTATAITHLFGGSCGREGAALQIGGSVASACADIFHLKTQERTVLIRCGMSAVFAGLFGTPLTAAIFTAEVVSVGSIFSPTLLQCYLSSYMASLVSAKLGVHAETAAISTVQLGLDNFWKFGIVAVVIALVGILLCRIFHFSEHLASKVIPNQWIRILTGAVVVIIGTSLVGDQRYNGAGMNMALDAINGQADWYDFILKLIFTAITLAAGFKGGEIVPVFCIGATCGCTLGTLLGADPGFCAALGLIGLFCAVTKSPLASVVLSVEMFGGGNLHLFALVCVICFVLSGKATLYTSQDHHYYKDYLSEVLKNRK